MRPWPALLPLLYAGSALAYYPATGRVVVVNASGVDLRVKIPDRGTEVLPAGRRLVVDLPAGEAVVKAHYRQFGMPMLLERNRVDVRGGSVTTVVLDPEDEARVMVTNLTPIEADVMVGGVLRGHLAAGASTVVSTAPGVQTLALVGFGGRAIATTRMDLRPYGEPIWTVDRPVTADVTVTNPLPIPVRIVADGQASRIVDAGQRVVLHDLPLGYVRLTATRLTGEAIDDEQLDLSWGSQAAWRIDPPRTGLVLVDSEHGRTTWVGIDGYRLGQITPWGEMLVEVPIGWQRLVVTDDRGMRVEDDWIEVRPFEVVRMRAAIGGPQRPQRPPPGYGGWERDGNADGWGGPHDRPEWHGERHDDDHRHDGYRDDGHRDDARGDDGHRDDERRDDGHRDDGHDDERRDDGAAPARPATRAR